MTNFCPSCGSSLSKEVKYCTQCGESLTEVVTKNRAPGIIWLLPIFFMLIGGVVAALIASMKYQASWWEFLVVGIAMTFIWYAAYFFILTSALGIRIF